MANIIRLVFVALVSFAAACTEENEAMSLEYFDKIYVPLGAGTFASMQKALEEKGIGNVMVSDTVHEYVYHESSKGGVARKDLILYSDASFIPSGTAYRAMTVRGFYTVALDDAAATGIVVNPNVPGRNSYTIDKAKIKEALPKFKEAPEPPGDIMFVP